MAGVRRRADPYAYGRRVIHPFRRNKSEIEIETGGTDWQENHIAKNVTEYQPKKQGRKAAKPCNYWYFEAFCAKINVWKMLRIGLK